jgi:hypothetical protein
MIAFRRKPVDRPAGDPTDENRFEQIRAQAAEAREKSDTIRLRRRAREAVDDNRLL